MGILQTKDKILLGAGSLAIRPKQAGSTPVLALLEEGPHIMFRARAECTHSPKKQAGAAS